MDKKKDSAERDQVICLSYNCVKCSNENWGSQTTSFQLSYSWEYQNVLWLVWTEVLVWVEHSPPRMGINQPSSCGTWFISWSGVFPDCDFCPISYWTVLAGVRRSVLAFACLLLGFLFPFFLGCYEIQEMSMIFPTPVCDSVVVLGYIDAFIKPLLSAEDIFPWQAILAPCVSENCCFWLRFGVFVGCFGMSV